MEDMGIDLPYAEDVGHYWQTSQSSPDVWMDRAKRIIQDLGGEIIADAYGSSSGRAAFIIAFKVKGQNYKVIWPVLPSYSGKDGAAKRQAATMLYHDVKAKAMTASVLGVEVAFFSYMMLPDGRVSSELTRPELAEAFPKLLT
jgi:hypothetical protein